MSRPGRVAWLAVLALPALAFAARSLLAARDEDRLASPERRRPVAAVDATAWECDGEWNGFGRVVARLQPLHADPTRQAFESATLRGRVAGLAGDPYRVQIAIQRASGATARLDPAALRVVDDAGTALTAPRVDEPASADPVAAVLRPPAPIAAGEQASFLLFGRAPGPGARLVDGDGAGLPLATRAGPADAVDLPIASVDRTTRSAEAGGR